jgi:hypothetical protein
MRAFMAASAAACLPVNDGRMYGCAAVCTLPNSSQCQCGAFFLFGPVAYVCRVGVDYLSSCQW